MEKVVADDYFDIKRVSEIASTEKLVAWDEKVADKIENSYSSVLKLLNKDTGEIRKFTSSSKMDYQPKFSPDGTKLAFISTRNEKPQVFLMYVDGGEAWKLTNEKNGVQSYSWSPDGKHIAYTSMVDPNAEEDKKKPETKFEKEQMKAEDEEKERKLIDPRVITKLVYRQGTSYIHPDRFAHLFVIDIESKESRRISDGYYHHSEPCFIDNENVIANSKRELPIDLSEKMTLLKFNINEIGEGDTITEFRATWINKPVADSLDRCFVQLSDEGTLAGQNQYWGHLKGKDIELINKELDRNIVNMKIVDENTIFVAVTDEGRVDIREYDLDTGEFTKLFDTEESIVDFTAVSKDEIYFTATSATKVWAVWKWSKDDGVELVDDPNSDGLSGKSLVDPEEMWFTNPEGIKYQGWFFDASKLEGNDEKPPFVLSIHGGPHVMWTNGGTMMHEWQYTVNSGYSVLALNPIGSQGYGQDFSQLIVPAKWGLADARDLMQAVDEISDRINTDRMYVTGGSYAGFQTANIVSRYHNFKAAVAQRGVYNFVNFGYVTDIPIWFNYEMGGRPHDSSEKLQELWDKSPLGRANEITTPLLILHAENDFRVPISEAESLFAALKLQDKEAVFVRYPRDGHELSRSGEPLHVVDRLERMIDWFDSHK